VLLGFEPLDGPHSGAYLSKTVIKVLQQHNIMKRVLSVTTNNALNNNTMVAGIQEVGQSLGLGEDHKTLKKVSNTNGFFPFPS
jgi:hypothetical protein